MIKEENSGAFTTLYDRYAEKLFAIAYHFSGRKCIAEDMVQEVFTSLWDRRCSLEIISMAAYLATAVKFSVFACLQKEFRRKKILEKIPIAANIAYSGESEVNAIFMKEKLDNTIYRLPEKCKIVYKCSREEGMSVKEIAKKMNLSPKTVENHLFRALHALRIALRNAYLTPLLFPILYFLNKS